MAAGAAAAAAIAQAIKASGAIVRLESNEFMRIVGRMKEPLVVMAKGGFFTSNYQYLVNYKGLIFYAKCETPLPLPGDVELVTAGRIWIPG
jgi:hypothetical protein